MPQQFKRFILLYFKLLWHGPAMRDDLHIISVMLPVPLCADNQLSYMPQQPKCFYTNNTEDNTRNISFWQELPLTKKPRSMRGVLIPLAKLAGFHHYQIMVNLTTWK